MISPPPKRKRSQQEAQMQQANALIEKTHQLLQAKKASSAEWIEKAAHFRAERDEWDKELQTLQLTFRKNRKQNRRVTE